MEFLKELFGGGSLTYEQLSAAAKEKGLQVVNAAGGAWVPKADADNLQGQVTTLTGQLEAQQFEFALEKAVAAAKPRNTRAVTAMLDREKLRFAGGEIIGLEKQLADLKKGEDTAFLFEDAAHTTGLSHQNGREVGGGETLKDTANQAIRSFFGRAE